MGLNLATRPSAQAALAALVTFASCSVDSDSEAPQRIQDEDQRRAATAPTRLSVASEPENEYAPPPLLLGQVRGLKSSSRMAEGGDGLVLVSDTKGGVVGVYDESGKRVGTLSGITAPLGVAVVKLADKDKHKDKKKDKKKDKHITETTRVYVGDEAIGGVRVFDGGKPVGFLGRGEGEFGKPNAIVVTSALNVYVVDSLAAQVFVYGDKLDKKSLFVFGSPAPDQGGLLFPTDIALNEAAGEVYVSEFANGHVAVFDLAGTWKRTLGAPPNSRGDPAFVRPAGLGIDPGGDLYVVDNALSCVVVMTPTGELVDMIGYDAVGGYWKGELRVPVDALSIGATVWVSSSSEGTISIYEWQ